MEFAVWAIAGWCGTMYRYLKFLEWLRRILRYPLPPPPPGEPWPIEPFVGNPWIEVSIGVIGGLIGGFLFNSLGTGGALTRIDLAATSFGALLGGNFASRLSSLAPGRENAGR
jgi:hypothetical protein